MASQGSLLGWQNYATKLSTNPPPDQWKHNLGEIGCQCGPNAKRQSVKSTKKGGLGARVDQLD
jgi:hypothetical protein